MFLDEIHRFTDRGVRRVSVCLDQRIGDAGQRADMAVKDRALGDPDAADALADLVLAHVRPRRRAGLGDEPDDLLRGGVRAPGQTPWSGLRTPEQAIQLFTGPAAVVHAAGG